MNNFNYQKAYCTQALPAFNKFNKMQKTAFKKLHFIVKSRNQNRNLNIPMCEKTDKALQFLSCLEIAELSRSCYFVGHWQPSYIDSPFNNSSGQSWKISNVCDQALRARLLPCKTLQIHEGTLRVTFSNRDCWLWDEFGLATEKNIKLFKNCNLPFGENTISESAKSLAAVINDIWLNVDNMPTNKTYDLFLKNQKLARIEKEKQRNIDKLASLKKNIETAKQEHKAFTWLIEAGIETDNCIYYNHTDIFSFGWRTPLTTNEKTILTKSLKNFPYNWELK